MAGAIRKHLGAEIGRQARDPRLASVYVETVELSPDLGLIRVGVRALVAVDAQGRRGIVIALNAMAKGLRASLAPVLRMRRMPELRFFYDEGEEHRARIEAVLSEIQAEDRQRALARDPNDEATSGTPAESGSAPAESGSDESGSK